MIVTAKTGAHAQRHVDHARHRRRPRGRRPLGVRQGLGAAWPRAPRSTSATTSSTSHGARAADAVAVAVASGPCSVDELAAAGADVVLESLGEFPAWWESFVLDHRLGVLEAELRRHDKLMVAFSGGADSAFLLAAAVRALGADNVVAATAISDSLPASELDEAREFAAELGVRAADPAYPRDRARGLPAKRRRPLLLLQGRADRGAHPAGARPRLLGRGDRDQRRRRPGRVPPGHPGRRRAWCGHSAAERRAHQGRDPGGVERDGACARGTSPPRRACRPGSPTGSR